MKKKLTLKELIRRDLFLTSNSQDALSQELLEYSLTYIGVSVNLNRAQLNAIMDNPDVSCNIKYTIERIVVLRAAVEYALIEYEKGPKSESPGPEGKSERPLPDLKDTIELHLENLKFLLNC